jgi:hypothetical protein
LLTYNLKIGQPYATWRYGGDVIQKRGHERKALASLAMLVSWEIWKERNARVFSKQGINF